MRKVAKPWRKSWVGSLFSGLAARVDIRHPMVGVSAKTTLAA